MSKLQILVRKMRSLALNPCASDGTNKRPQTIAAGWKNTNQNRVQEKILEFIGMFFDSVLAENISTTICLKYSHVRPFSKECRRKGGLYLVTNGNKLWLRTRKFCLRVI